MKLENEFVVPRGIDQTWAVLTDVERIAPAMPGAQLTEVVDGKYHGTVKVKVGPVTAGYAGVATFKELDPAAHHMVLEATGKESSGRGRASALVTADLTAEGEAQTRVKVVTDLTISGPLAQFGRGAIAEVSAKLLKQFVSQLETTVLNDAPVTPPASAAPAPPAAAPGAPAAAGATAPGTSAPGEPTAPDLPTVGTTTAAASTPSAAASGNGEFALADIGPPTETTAPPATSAPAQTSAPAEASAPAQTGAPTETSAPAESAAASAQLAAPPAPRPPAETSTLAETGAPAQTRAPGETTAPDLPAVDSTGPTPPAAVSEPEVDVPATAQAPQLGPTPTAAPAAPSDGAALEAAMRGGAPQPAVPVAEVNLLKVAAWPILKRLIPVLVAIAIIVILIVWLA